MGRWEPNARGRMQRAAMELYIERGYEQTTVADIADRAGVTERTYFRHFADKREVLFEGSAVLETTILEAVASAPPGTPPIHIVGLAMQRGAGGLPARDLARARTQVITANASLQERELLKLATLSASIAGALRERGVAELPARVAADTGVIAFSIGFDRWIAQESTADLAGSIGEVLAELRSQATSAEPSPGVV